MSAAEDRLGLATREEVIAACRVSPRTFDRRVLPYLSRVVVGRRVLFRWEEVERWLEDQEVGPSNETAAPGSGSSGFGTLASGSTGPRARRFVAKLRQRQRASMPKSPPGDDPG